MLTRALIVLLVVLNLGVAAWWIWRPDPNPAMISTEPPSGIARLRLVQEPTAQPTAVRAEMDEGRTPAEASPGDDSTAPSPPTSSGPRADTATPAPSEPASKTPPGTASTTASDAPATSTSATTNPADRPQAAAAPPTPPARCFRVGPYPDPLARAAALPALRPLVADMRSSEGRAAPGRGWRVLVPPATDADAARSMAERIRAAGFSDYFVVTDGPDAHAIALGRFSSEDRARQHAAALVAAGFPARAEALGESRPQYWVDVTAAPAATLAGLRTAADGVQVRTTACPGG